MSLSYPEFQAFLFLPSSCEGLNTALRGGLQRGTIVSVFGSTETYKTILCTDLAFNEALTHEGKVLYLDADAAGGVNDLRILDMLQTRGIKVMKPTFKGTRADCITQLATYTEKLLAQKHITLKRIYSLKELETECLRTFKEIKEPYSLIVVDTLTLYFKVISTINLNYSRDEVATIAKIASAASRYVKKTKAIVIFVLQHTSRINEEKNLKARDRVREYVGGDAVAHFTNTILEMIIKPQTNEHVCVVYKNRAGKNTEVPIAATDGGVV
jgi:KaiC/GvpD/RAD55 family RecA-like ATPase